MGRSARLRVLPLIDHPPIETILKASRPLSDVVAGAGGLFGSRDPALGEARSCIFPVPLVNRLVHAGAGFIIELRSQYGCVLRYCRSSALRGGLSGKLMQNNRGKHSSQHGFFGDRVRRLTSKRTARKSPSAWAPGYDDARAYSRDGYEFRQGQRRPRKQNVVTRAVNEWCNRLLGCSAA